MYICTLYVLYYTYGKSAQSRNRIKAFSRICFEPLRFSIYVSFLSRALPPQYVYLFSKVYSSMTRTGWLRHTPRRLHTLCLFRSNFYIQVLDLNFSVGLNMREKVILVEFDLIFFIDCLLKYILYMDWTAHKI